MPTMFTYMNIYAFMGMDNLSWGTREAGEKGKDVATKDQNADMKEVKKRSYSCVCGSPWQWLLCISNVSCCSCLVSDFEIDESKNKTVTNEEANKNDNEEKREDKKEDSKTKNIHNKECFLLEIKSGNEEITKYALKMKRYKNTNGELWKYGMTLKKNEVKRKNVKTRVNLAQFIANHSENTVIKANSGEVMVKLPKKDKNVEVRYEEWVNSPAHVRTLDLQEQTMDNFPEQLFLEWLVSEEKDGPLYVEKEKFEDEYSQKLKKDHDEKLQTELKQLRNGFLGTFFGFNLAWLVLMTAITILGSILDFNISAVVPTKPCTTSQNKTASEDGVAPDDSTCLQGFCGYPCIYTDQNPLTLLFLVFYLVLLLIQFFCMLVHRWLSLMTYFQLKVCSWSTLKKEFGGKSSKSETDESVPFNGEINEGFETSNF